MLQVHFKILSQSFQEEIKDKIIQTIKMILKQNFRIAFLKKWKNQDFKTLNKVKLAVVIFEFSLKLSIFCLTLKYSIIYILFQDLRIVTYCRLKLFNKIKTAKNYSFYNFVNNVSKFYKQMNQSSTSVGLNLRSKGLRNSSGTLMKGCVKDATTKLSIGSIPSNYQTIIYHSESTKAFGTSQKRFYQQSKVDLQKTDIPNDSQLSQPQPTINPSHSKKGYGPFIAKQQRNWIDKKQAPGPGRYQSTKSAQPTVKRFKKRLPCYSRQKKQNIQPTDIQKKETPGPGEYYLFQKRNANNGWKSAFKTKMSRNTYLQYPNTPGPGYYDVKLIKHAKSIIKQPVDKIQKPSTNQILQVLDSMKNSDFPGPGSYQYDMPNFKPLYERIKISGNFMLSKKDRFNNQIDKFTIDQTPEYTPNMYSYNLKSQFDDQQRLIKWPCFMSQSKRMVFSGQKKLGPSFITPKLQNRRNFHFNIKGAWF